MRTSRGASHATISQSEATRPARNGTLLEHIHPHRQAADTGQQCLKSIRYLHGSTLQYKLPKQSAMVPISHMGIQTQIHTTQSVIKSVSQSVKVRWFYITHARIAGEGQQVKEEASTGSRRKALQASKGTGRVHRAAGGRTDVIPVDEGGEAGEGGSAQVLVAAAAAAAAESREAGGKGSSRVSCCCAPVNFPKDTSWRLPGDG
mmetsp:Transcript_10963/g.28591  ORF Transcript_10963/g.28591 Transcript_10963/m.28591 type:complete len:204 (-) Transcript_10963:1866-2477(-)